MDFPKLVLASDGRHTGVLLDGVFIGSGIERLEFSTHDAGGQMRVTIRVIDLDVDRAKLSTIEDFERFMENITAPAATGAVNEVKE